MSVAFRDVIKKYPRAITSDEASSVYDQMPSSYQAYVDKSVFVDYLSSRNRQNIFWYDYEAGGTDAKSAPPMQIAAIRTDLQHRPIDEPIDWYCQLHGDKLPHPQAVALTKISPLKCSLDGLPEPLFFRLIELETTVPETCSTGHNSMGYDEDMTRFGLWRNCLPVYPREFANGNSRWDTMNLLSAFSALDVPGIEWPVNDQGNRSLRLEHFASANGITQEHAHNAVDDVKAMIDASRLLQNSNPDLWQHLFENRTKKQVQKKLTQYGRGLWIAALAGAQSNFNEPVLVLGKIPGEFNKYGVLKLSDVELLRAHWSIDDLDELRRRLFMKKEALEEAGLERPPVQSITINKAPVFLSREWLLNNFPDKWCEEWDLLCDKLKVQPDFLKKMLSVLTPDEFSDEQQDIELQLYSQGFPSDRDQVNIEQIKSQPIAVAYGEPFAWENPVYQALWERARCKLDGYEGVTLSSQEKSAWVAHCKLQLNSDLIEEAKHERVNFHNIDTVLENTEMDDSLRKEYTTWLNELRERLA